MKPWTKVRARRLDEVRRLARVTQEQLIERTGIPRATLQRILGGTSVPDEDKLAAILGALDASEKDLDGEEDTPFVLVPHYDIEVAAGPGRFLDNEAVIGRWPFPREWVARELGPGADLAILRVSGDSQEPELRDGDSVMIDRNVRRREGMAVVRVDDALLIKRVQIEGRTARLVSNNPAYDPIIVDLNNDARFEFVGRAVWVGKLL